MTQSTYKIDFILVEISGSVLGKKCSTKWWKTSCRSTKCISRSDQHLLGMRKQLSPDASTWYKLGIVDLNPVLLEAQWIRISYSSCFSHQERNFPASSTFNLYSRPLFLQTYLQLHLVLWFYVNIHLFHTHLYVSFFQLWLLFWKQCLYTDFTSFLYLNLLLTIGLAISLLALHTCIYTYKHRCKTT